MKYLFTSLFSLIILPLNSFSQCQSIPSNAVAWWDADNTSGLMASDIRGGQNGQLRNGASINAGYVCNAFDLDGANDHISIAHSDSLTFSDSINDRPFSIEAWINLRDVSTSMIFCKGDDNKREYSFRLTGTSADYLAVGLYDDRRSQGGNYNVIGLRSTYNFKQDENSWVHVACSYDGSGISSGIKLYRNGAQLPTTILIGTDSLGLYSAMRMTETDATIGRFFTDGPQFLDGKVDELTVYSKELSAQEINNIFLADADGKCATPIDADTSGCHDAPWVSVETVRSNQGLISRILNTDNGIVDLQLNETQSGQFQVYNSEGKELINNTFNSSNKLSVNLSEFNSGLYIILLRTSQGRSETFKWIKKN